MKDLVIILDNGHGSNTPGKCSPDRRILEWKWTREIASMIYEELLKENITAILPFPQENDVPLKERVEKINDIYKQSKKAGKDCLLISIHINASGNGGWHQPNGWTVWVSNNASKLSKDFAQIIYQEALNNALGGNRSIPRDRYWSADYYILKNSNCPAVLTENMFQDNKEDVEFLLSDEGKKKIVNIHIEAIKKYISL